MRSLTELGFGPDFQEALAQLGDATLQAMRVAEVHGARFRLLAAQGEVEGVLTGRMRFDSDELELPAVGDWVAVEDTRPARIVRVLRRRSSLVRQAPGDRVQAQVLAANVDLVLVVSAVGRDFNLRRVERYLAAIVGGGAAPALVLNKCDLSEDSPVLLEQLQALAPEAPVVGVSAQSGEGLEQLRELLYPGCTVALVGSSGVGKSTLINRLLGEDRLAVGEVRASDEKGRHTTSSRQLLPVPLGANGWALLMDTPGLRELQLWSDSASVDAVFPAIARLAEGCHFPDCTHLHEPDCAVRAAVDRGELEAQMLHSLHKLQREQQHQAKRQDLHARLEGRRREKVFGRIVRQLDQIHPKRWPGK